MPRTDPISGCQVMTMPEFLQAEAAAEGKEPHEILDEIYSSIEEDNENMRKDLRKNALGYIQEEAKNLLDCWTEDAKHNGEVSEHNYHDFKTGQWVTKTSVFDAGPRPPQPVSLIDVLDAQHSQTFRSSKTKLVAKCKADDGKEYIYTLCRGDYSGSFYEPPDSEVELQWTEC